MFGHTLLARAGRLFTGPAALPAPPKPSAPTSTVAAPFSIEQVLAPNAALLRRLRVAYGYRDRQFERHILAPLGAFAEWVHTLPGPPDSGFEHLGGAIEQAMTNCLHCLQAADGLTFDGATVGASLDTASKWRLACALGGLFAALPHLLSRIEVVSASGDPWPSAALPFQRWLGSDPAPRYRHRWKCTADDVGVPIAYVASQCISPDVMAYLIVDGSSRIGSALLSSIAGGRGPMTPSSPISELVTEITSSIVARRRPHSRSMIDDLHSEVSPMEYPLRARASRGTQQCDSGTCTADPDGIVPASTGADEASSLSLDTSAITNPFIRERIEETIARLDLSFDKMLAKVKPNGIFVALSECSTQRGDDSAIVRALFEGGLLAVDPLNPSRRVTRERIEGAEVEGVVLVSAALSGQPAWMARWRLDAFDNEAGQH